MASEEMMYAAIDLKSFYASVECVERGLDPLRTNLVVADESRTEKTICLAVSPSMKALGIPGRPRLFQVIGQVERINEERRLHAPGQRFTGASWDPGVLDKTPELRLDFITAVPRMALYIKYSTRIYEVYLKYVAPEDIHIYSIDEVFLDLRKYQRLYGKDARSLLLQIIRDVYQTTGITATAGLGTNLYLCKTAMDLVAKHISPDENGVRIAELDEYAYRRLLWVHRPLTDFWRIGRGYQKKLEDHGLYTMGDIARCSLGKQGDYHNAELLYRMFGVNAELLIDHAWGWESCTMEDIKAYRPKTKSVGTGQVLPCAYSAEKGRLILREMADGLALELVDKGLMAEQLVLTVGYDRVDSRKDGRKETEHVHGTENLEAVSSSSNQFMEAASRLYDRLVDQGRQIRRINLVAGRVISEAEASGETVYEQLSLFDRMDESEKKAAEERLLRERRLQNAILSIKKKYGKNAVLRGMNLEEGAMARERNRQIGGHRA